jgi:hypothetical protein
MKIIQKEDGSGEIYFSDEEIKVIQKHKKLILNKEFLKHFINLFIALFMEFQKNLIIKQRKCLPL